MILIKNDKLNYVVDTFTKLFLFFVYSSRFNVLCFSSVFLVNRKTCDRYLLGFLF